MEDDKTRIRRVLKEHCGIEEIADDKVFYSRAQDTGVVPHYSSEELDSLDHIELMMALEDEFEIEILDAIAPSLTTVNAIAAHVETMRQVTLPPKARRG